MTVLHHVACFDGSRWHTAYVLPGAPVLCSVMDAPTEAAALREARVRNERQTELRFDDPADRKIPHGFYENGE